jgi:hypothetical protein
LSKRTRFKSTGNSSISFGKEDFLLHEKRNKKQTKNKIFFGIFKIIKR